MSLVKTLARVAGGVLLARGLSGAMQNRNNNTTTAQNQQRGGGLLDQVLGGGNRQQAGTQRGGQGGGLGDLLGGLLGGAQGGGAGTGQRYGGPNSRGAQGGLGGILDQLTNTARSTRSGSAQGGLGDLLGQLAGGSKTSSGAGGLGGLLGGLLGGAAAGGAAERLAKRDSQETNDASFGELLNDALANNGEPEVKPTPEQNAVAGLMLKAMIQAAKADGKIDENERARLLDQLGDLDEEERAFVREQMEAPVDAEALARQVPEGLEAQIYTMSLMAIDFNSRDEAVYLHKLAEALNLPRSDVNDVHDQLGAERLYS
ncbi:MAG: tellurite resistance TerB family protein [Paracoccus sp. (in: a-proteobacteria)]|nr:tellurite resistance TerB family protein [Paracoccus sp. (in: a-proteobacteria)]